MSWQNPKDEFDLLKAPPMHSHSESFLSSVMFLTCTSTPPSRSKVLVIDVGKSMQETFAAANDGSKVRFRGRPQHAHISWQFQSYNTKPMCFVVSRCWPMPVPIASAATSKSLEVTRAQTALGVGQRLVQHRLFFAPKEEVGGANSTFHCI